MIKFRRSGRSFHGFALGAVVLAGQLFFSVSLAGGAVDKQPPPGKGIGRPSERISDGTLTVGIEVDRDQARLISYTRHGRPFMEPRGRGPRKKGSFADLEVALLGPGEKRFALPVQIGPLCLAHDPDSPPHMEGDVILAHRETFVVELPDLAGFNELEIAFMEKGPRGPVKRKVGREKFDRARFTPAGQEIDYLDLAVADARDTSKASGRDRCGVQWPEDLSDPDLYTVYGDPAEGGQRINIVIVPDGYTHDQKALMQQHADQLVFSFRAKTPFSEHDAFFNYTLVYAYSENSGTDQCDCDIVIDTAMGTGFPNTNDICGNSANRCLNYHASSCGSNCQDNIVEAELRSPYHDQTIIMVNTTRYGGCGGARATFAAGNGSGREIAIHELGHSLAGLADEYHSYTACGTYAGEINTSLDPFGSPWAEWLPEIGQPWEGAQYYSQCVFRPQFNCEMRNLNQVFCPVCNQHWSLVIFGHPRVSPTAPVADMTPASPAAVPLGGTVDFAVNTRLSEGPQVSNEFSWTVSGPGYPEPTVVASGVPQYTHAFTQEGSYQISCEVTADTNFVKPVKYADNQDVVFWDVAVGCADEDFDGFTTCDGDCNDGDPEIYPGAIEVCDDQVDNNCDGIIDTDDPACPEPCIPTAGTEQGKTCKDGIDNDCDGLTDGDDTDCGGSQGGEAEICDDGVDNDGDGKVDCRDRDCRQDPLCR
jgi:hypothetical protein